MLIKKEFEQNNKIREYLEKSYWMVMEQGDGKFDYVMPE